MGARVDAENNGQPNVTANGDDINPAGADDEDGVAFVSSLIPGQVATIKVDMTGSPAALYAELLDRLQRATPGTILATS